MNDLQAQQAAAAREAAWNATDKNNKAALQQFLNQYGDGSHAQDARTMIGALDRQQQDALAAARQAKQQATTNAADSTAVLNALKNFEAAYNQKSLPSLQGLWTGMPKSVAETLSESVSRREIARFSFDAAGSPQLMETMPPWSAPDR